MSERSSGDRSQSNGHSSGHTTGHRHRFVQDGEVQVVLAKHSGVSGVASGARGAPATPVSNRVAALASEVATERTARERAERGLQQALATVRDLQTKLAHAELSRTEALSAARADQETIATLRAELREREEAATAELVSERNARESAETALQNALAALNTAERRGTKPAPDVSASRIAKSATPRMSAAGKSAAPRKGREPKPVKWWIKSDAGAKR